ncbi:MAG: OmpA family protein [Flavobacteriales bacterium]|nr:OmpA family protein [Flavobacteriales bacterium]
MRKYLGFICLCLVAFQSYGQLHFLKGSWQGIMTTYNEPYEKGTAIWFDFNINEETGAMTGDSRCETPFTNYFAYKNIKGTAEEAFTISYEDVIIGLQENQGGRVWCHQKGKLTYDPETGYLTGDWSSSDCKRLTGKIVLFRSKHKMSKSDTVTLYHSWFNNMAFELNKGWKAYYVRDAEMRNFEFQPVYFDHDKDELKAEFESYLEDMVRVVESHSDLRIKIIGHTDSNGTDLYNVGLSERRAQRIKQFLMDHGLKEDRIEIEYRGETDPAMSNSNSIGKQLNRRVDFEFVF